MRRRWKILIAVAIVLFVLAAVWCVPPWYNVEAYRRMLLAHGEKLEIEEVLPPPVPSKQNGADLVNEAAGLVISPANDWSNEPSAMLMVAPGKAIVCFEQPDVRSSDFTNSWSNVMAIAEADRPAMELLKQELKFPAMDFHLDYSNEADMRLTNNWTIWQCAQRLSAEAICNLHGGDASSATTNLCALLALVNGGQDERILISQEDRMLTASFAAGATWELLQTTNSNDEGLAALQRSWERLEFVRAAENTVLMERASTESTIQRMRVSQEYFNHLATMGFGGPRNIFEYTKLAGTRFIWIVLWSYPDELRMLRDDQIFLETLRAVETNGYFYPNCVNMRKQLDASGSIDDHWIFSNNGVRIMENIGRTMAVEATRRIVVTAIALTRYQLKHGKYPPDLDSLIPEFVRAVPLDPVDGKPLRYRLRTDGTFLLYSIGANGNDDGGDPSTSQTHGWPYYYWLYWPDPAASDWVWPQPATTEEIQNFYAHPPKL